MYFNSIVKHEFFYSLKKNTKGMLIIGCLVLTVKRICQKTDLCHKIFQSLKARL